MADIEQIQDRILNLADEIGVRDTLAALREWRKWDDLVDAVTGDVIESGNAVDKDGYDHANAEIGRLDREINYINIAASRLHDAICEGRRQDAIDILNDITNGQHRSVREQRNLFPDRVPA